MSGEIADWQATLPERSRYGDHAGAPADARAPPCAGATCAANPAKLAGRNPQPPPRAVRVFTLAELDAIAAELSAAYRPLPAFAAATGLRPEEWARSSAATSTAARGICQRAADERLRGEVVELGKTNGSRRAGAADRPRARRARPAPAAARHAAAVPGTAGRPLNLDNFRRREWAPAIEAVRGRQARADLRPALDVRLERARRRLTVFELARIMGTSVRMIERHYGALLDGAHAGIAGRLDALEAELVQVDAGS